MKKRAVLGFLIVIVLCCFSTMSTAQTDIRPQDVLYAVLMQEQIADQIIATGEYGGGSVVGPLMWQMRKWFTPSKPSVDLTILYQANSITIVPLYYIFCNGPPYHKNLASSTWWDPITESKEIKEWKFKTIKDRIRRRL